MPEFHLDVHDNYADWKRLDAFTQGYVEAIFFTEMEHGTDSESHDPERHSALHGDLTFADLAPEALADIIADCSAFQEHHAELLDKASERVEGYDSRRAGVDYCFTRNHHGAGFWDRGLGAVGNDLTTAAHSDGEVWVYLGDDGKVYLS